MICGVCGSSTSNAKGYHKYPMCPSCYKGLFDDDYEEYKKWYEENIA